ncbi:MAG: aminotransferase class I/II-fold pyridoxal phosphate-dependent enzyme [Parachlamydiaceae bacterium]
MNKKNDLRVPYGSTVHGEDEIAAVVNVLRTNTQMGQHVAEMERRVAALYAKQHGIMVNSGSSANYLAIEIADLPKGSEVITPALTFSTTVAPLVKHHLVPAFIDVSEGTYNIDVDQIEPLITKHTKAMMIPNLLGNLPDWQHLRTLADQYQLLLIEDSADTLGATMNGASTGHFSDITTTSFYGSHVINCAGNGGMLCVNDPLQMERAKLLRSWGRSSSLFVESEAIENRFNVDLEGIRYDAKFVFETIGYNLEPSEMGAAFGAVQLNQLDQNISLRQKWFSRHYDFFSQYEDWFILPKQFPNSQTAWLAFPLTVKSSAPFTRTDMQIFMEKRNIQTRTIFTGNVLRQPAFKNIAHRGSVNDFKEADRVMRGGILLGCHHGLTDEMVEHVHDSFKTFAL